MPKTMQRPSKEYLEQEGRGMDLLMNAPVLFGLQQQIRERLNEAQGQYQIIRDDAIDPILEEKIRELYWVLDE